MSMKIIRLRPLPLADRRCGKHPAHHPDHRVFPTFFWIFRRSRIRNFVRLRNHGQLSAQGTM